ncbi:DUF397 domain-containing protein [Actinomadura sp. LD22]|uniref:DUF397 domain-containing protein n=1 Tax=Actinomadura physcomitrii TaxID=2650748 RepID=A0A6I4MDC3_9ACTN|nr:DUF397 domain-containing protein [Actinomadura physcomitrii]MWA03712.1 DUF397 domain-containing protein [Actinomadura physcomitrii]
MSSETIASAAGATGWRKSARCAGNGACVEVGSLRGGAVAARDAYDGDTGPVLRFSAAEWRAFAAAAKAGRFDLAR